MKRDYQPSIRAAQVQVKERGNRLLPERKGEESRLSIFVEEGNFNGLAQSHDLLLPDWHRL